LKYGFISAVERSITRVAHALEHHPKHVTALVVAVLLGGGGGAFAVASLGPDVSTVPVSQIVEAVEPLPLQAQSEALDVHSINLFRTEIVRSSDTVETLLNRLGVSDDGAAAYLRSEPHFRGQFLGHAGRSVTVETNEKHGLARLTGRWAPEDNGQFKRLVVERNAAGAFVSRVETGMLTASARLGSGTIRTSLFAAMDDARIPDEVAMQIADVFSSGIDFHRGLRRGDRFNVVYESLEADGETLRSGRILSVEFVNAGKVHQAMWFQEPGRKGAYYTLDGKSLSSSYLASPMEFSRVSSGFSMRFHPILQQWRAHLGVDYAAPTGTPVRSVGDGVVEFAGVQNGFGNVVMVRHSNSDVSLYAHLHTMEVQPGQKVMQGQKIGGVGATGWATGPHLHFEFRVDGVHQDPIEMARRSEGSVLSGAARPAFEQAARTMRMHLAAASVEAQVASAD
jgi:murein DD-endopeptidase MepM/ murein hydrolase activator NlpD